MQLPSLRIGTRSSPLALVQARLTAQLLVKSGLVDSDAVEIVPIRTTGDIITDRPLTEAGGKGLFTKELDEALLGGRIDLAVHSAKDMPTRLVPGLAIAACLEREDVRDAFLSPSAKTISSLPRGASLGTSSLRRRAMALRLRPDLRMIDLRGNVETRMRKIAEGIADATLLAAAGLRRLGFIDKAASLIDTEDWLPAAGQGIIAITVREDDAVTAGLVAKLDQASSSMALAAERAFLDALDGSCRTPIGAYARLGKDVLSFRGIIVKPDGSDAHDIALSGHPSDAERIGRAAGLDLVGRGGSDFFRVG